MIHEIIKYGLLGIGGTIVSSYIIESQMKNYDTVIEPPVDSVSIIMPSYNESLYIQKSLESIKNQSIIQEYPEYFEIIVVDSNSSDGTPELSKLYADKVLTVGKGKLTAKNMAIDIAKGNIIVSADGDTEYLNGWLNTLLKPFKNPGIVGTSGSTLDYNIPFVPGQIHSIFSVLNQSLFYPNQLVGRNCAFRKDIFYKIGKYNENVNQQDLQVMLFEEETGFGDRIAKHGKVEYLLNASCVHKGGFKVGCRMKTADEKACELLGIGKSRF